MDKKINKQETKNCTPLNQVKRLVMRFWKKLYLLSEKKYKNCHANKHHNDIKCPNCKMWFSVSGIKYKHKHLPENDLFIPVECGQCGEKSNWSPHIASVLIRVDNAGDPIGA